MISSCARFSPAAERLPDGPSFSPCRIMYTAMPSASGAAAAAVGGSGRGAGAGATASNVAKSSSSGSEIGYGKAQMPTGI